jgi:tetratricopeptide (TPR) repeat protein
MTQSEVADEQFSVSYISAVERGQIRPSLGALEQLSERLDVPLADLVSDAHPGEAPVIGGREAAAERRQEEADTKMRNAQVFTHLGRAREAQETLRTINPNHLPNHSVMEWRRLLSFTYLELDQAEEARKEALEGIAITERANDEEMRARLRNELGCAYLLERKNQLALEQFRLAYDAVNRGIIRDPAFRLNVLYNLGTTYWLLNQTADAIGALREAVDQSATLNNPETLGNALFALSSSYSSQGDSRRAKLYAQRALMAYEQADNRRLTARAYARLGRAAAQANQIDESLDLLSQALAMTEREQDARGQAEVQRSLAAVFVSQKRNNEAKAAAQKALELAQSVNDDILLAESLLAMAQVQDGLGQAKQAEATYEQAIALLEKADARQHLGDAYAAFSTFLEARGQSQRALEVLRQAWNIREGAPA